MTLCSTFIVWLIGFLSSVLVKGLELEKIIQ